MVCDLVMPTGPSSASSVEPMARSRTPAMRERMTEPPHALYSLPLPQGQRSLRPTRVDLRTDWAVASPSSAWVNPLLDSASEAGS